MASNSVANPEHSTVQSTPRTAVPTRPTAAISSILNNAQNNNINNNTFVTNIKGGTRTSLEALDNRVAPNAILNAGGRADEVRCHPGTRTEVIGRIEKWRAEAQDGTKGSRMFWLSGPAGAGKSAIVQTVADSWSSHGIYAANFFFFRSDTSRNHAGSFVATLLYQIFEFYPEAREAVDMVLTTKPRILEASLQEQFDKLICFPLRSIGQRFLRPVVLLIDGLDECDSEGKTSQQQILQVLGMLAGRHDVSFLVLVASRVEHQIKMGFSQVSCNLDAIFLDDKYQPEEDIRLFVVDQFEKIKQTHYLAPSDASWPSTSAVDGIVAKSSGQFIYAATAMRFISDSPAAPELSLQKVQGIARIGSKSPFSELDALYTYILASADDQEALKEILHAYFFVSTMPWPDGVQNERGLMRTANEGFTLEKCLRIQDDRYTNSTIGSYIADVAAVACFDRHKLTFYHASLTDYLQDQARSGAYFIDGTAFDLKIVPLLFKHKYDGLAYTILPRLTTVTLDIMRSCNAQYVPLFSRIGDLSDGHLILLHDLCVRHDAVAEYREFLLKWLTNRIGTNPPDIEQPSISGIPYLQRYMTMAKIDRDFGKVQLGDPYVVVDSLCPESAADGHEIALWLQRVFMRMYRRCYLEEYKQLLRQWTSWAISNNVPFCNLHKVPDGDHLYHRGVGVQDIPYSQRYITMARIEHINGDLPQDCGIILDMLHWESVSDVKQSTLWVQSLLQRIQREHYPQHLGTYKRLIMQWISWANSNNIPLLPPHQFSNDDLPSFKLENIPYGRLYLMMTRVDSLYGDIWQKSDIVVDVLRPESVSDVDEVAPWIHNLLQSIKTRFYSDHLKTYKRLMRQWITWAVSSKIPLSALQQSPSDDLPSFNLKDIPYGRMYITMAQIDSLCGDIWQNFDLVDDVFGRKSASDTEEVALWLNNLLQSINTKFYPNHRLKYKQLITGWTMWAVLNDIPLVGLDDLPNAHRYLIEGAMKKWIASHVNFLL